MLIKSLLCTAGQTGTSAEHQALHRTLTSTVTPTFRGNKQNQGYVPIFKRKRVVELLSMLETCDSEQQGRSWPDLLESKIKMDLDLKCRPTYEECSSTTQRDRTWLQECIIFVDNKIGNFIIS